jgi:hypothetical protein
MTHVLKPAQSHLPSLTRGGGWRRGRGRKAGAAEQASHPTPGSQTPADCCTWGSAWGCAHHPGSTPPGRSAGGRPSGSLRERRCCCCCHGCCCRFPVPLPPPAQPSTRPVRWTEEWHPPARAHARQHGRAPHPRRVGGWGKPEAPTTYATAGVEGKCARVCVWGVCGMSVCPCVRVRVRECGFE